jgi:hypothetical protein
MVVGALGLALAACESPPLEAPEAAAAPALAPPAETAEPAATAPAGGGETAEPPAPEPAAPETAALPAEPEIDDDPARLLGLDDAGLAELLGQPDLKRREPPAEIWQYRGGSCVFDVFLYAPAGTAAAGGPRVTYLEARDGAARRIATRACLNELLRARLDKPLG